jgi:hypothetical protein
LNDSGVQGNESVPGRGMMRAIARGFNIEDVRGPRVRATNELGKMEADLANTS